MADFDEDRWWYEIQNTIPAECLFPGEQDQLRTMVLSAPFKKAVTMVYAECVGTGTAMLQIDLTTPEGVSEGLRLQGKAQGMIAMLQGLVDLAKEQVELLEGESV